MISFAIVFVHLGHTKIQFLRLARIVLLTAIHATKMVTALLAIKLISEPLMITLKDVFLWLATTTISLKYAFHVIPSVLLVYLNKFVSHAILVSSSAQPSLAYLPVQIGILLIL